MYKLKHTVREASNSEQEQFIPYSIRPTFKSSKTINQKNMLRPEGSKNGQNTY